MDAKLSDRYIRNVIRQHVGKMPISSEAIAIIKEYIDSEIHRIVECGVKEFMSQNEYRKRPKYRLPGSVFKGVLNT